MINFYNTMLTSPLLYFKCTQGHFTSCQTPKHRVVFCKECNLFLAKKDCDRYTDSFKSIKPHKKTIFEQYDNKRLYKFPESTKINYRNIRVRALLGLDRRD